MGKNVVMRGRDAIFAALAQCYVTIDDKRYNFMQMIDFEAKVDKDKVEIPILGKTGKGNKAVGWKGTFKGTAHYNQSIFRKLLLKYKKTGEDIYFDIQVVNEDPTSAAGKQSIILTGCNLDGGILAKFDADGEYLDEDIEGTFEDWSMPKQFTELEGM
jgi:hypothetical protein